MIAEEQLVRELRGAISSITPERQWGVLASVIFCCDAPPEVTALSEELARIRTDPRLRWAAAAVALGEAGLEAPSHSYWQRLAKGGLPKLLVPDGFARLVAGPGAEKLAPLLMRAPAVGAKATTIHVVLPQLPAAGGGVSRGETALPTEATRDSPTPEGEEAVLQALEAIRRQLGESDLALVLVPDWALADATRLADLRSRWLTNGALRRVVELPSDPSMPRGFAFAVVGRPRLGPRFTPVREGVSVSDPSLQSLHFQPVALPRVGRPDEQEIRWFSTPLLAGFATWRVGWGSEPTAEDHALFYLRNLTAGGLPVAAAIAEVGKTVDEEYLDRLLGQPPYVRALARGRGEGVLVPIPELARQREIAVLLRSGTADMYELACLFQGVDPRDGSKPPDHGTGRRYMDEIRHVVESAGRRAPSFFGRLVAYVDRTIGRDDDRVAGFAPWTRLAAALADAIAIISDSEQVSDIGLRIAMLSAAIARLDADRSEGTVDRLARRQLRDSLVADRARAIGAANLRVQVIHASGSGGRTRVSLKLENKGRTALFGLRLAGRRLATGREATGATRVLETKGHEHVVLNFSGDEVGEDRLELRWEARDVLGDTVKGRLVLPVEVRRRAPEREFTLLSTPGSWDILTEVAADLGADAWDRAIAQALLAYRAGDEAGLEGGMIAAGEDPDMATVVGVLCSAMGRERLARDVLEEAWSKAPDEGELALAVGRVRAWSGDDDLALVALGRAAAEFSSEGLAVSAAVHTRRGRHGAAEEQVRGLDLDDSTRLALTPYRILRGDATAIDAASTLVRDPEADDEEVAWVLLDLLHFGLARAALALVADWAPDPSFTPAELLRALILARSGDLDGARAELDRVYGEGHRVDLSPAPLTINLPPNPYIIGKAIQDSGRFFGRDLEIERILSVVAPPGTTGVVLLEGERRVGKTSILHRVRARLPEDTLCALLNLQELGARFQDRDVWSALSTSLRRARGLGPKARRETPLAADYTSFSDEIETVLVEGRWRGVVLLIDEFEVLDAAVESGTATPVLVAQLRHLVQTQPVGVVVAGAHELSRSRRAYRSPLFGFAVRVRVASLDASSARSLLARPTEGVFAWSPAALAHALALTDAQPFFLQHLGWQIFEGRRARARLAPVTVGEVEAAVAPTLIGAEEHLDALYDALPGDTARRLVRRLAAEPVLDPAGLPVEVLRVDEDSGLALDELLDRGVVAHTGAAEVRLSVGLFHQRVAERHPWEGP